jgi:cyclopropane-fatty-acyl-phospholipid synthase
MPAGRASPEDWNGAEDMRGACRRARALLLRLIDAAVLDARIEFLVEGRVHVAGRGPATTADDARLAVRIHRPRFFGRVLAFGNLGLGEAFIEGDFDMEHGSLHELLTTLLRAGLEDALKRDTRLAVAVAATSLRNRLRGKRGNVRRHYDAGEDLFESFLDSRMTYSCGYAHSPDDDLEQLQTNKLDRICRKLDLRPGDRLLDIGCGFGSLLIHAAEQFGVTGAGYTSSRSHSSRACAEIARRGLADRLRVECADYGAIRGAYSKVVSVGMMEHVPRREYERFFRVMAEALEPRGTGLLHTIGCNWFRNEHDPFIQRYIFPGSSQPRLSEIARGLERNRLAILDVENIKPHYRHTVLRWLERFRASRDALDPARYSTAFKRMWEYYLSCGIAAASASNAAVYQVLFSNSHTAPLRLHRV